MAVFLALALLMLCALRQQQRTRRNAKTVIGMMKTAGFVPVSMSRRESLGWDASSADHMGESRTRLRRTGAIVDKLKYLFKRDE